MRFLIVYLVVFFTVGPLKISNARGLPQKSDTTKSQKRPSASKTESDVQSVQVGDQVRGLRVLPPWTMRRCPNLFYATYTFEEAKELKKADLTCTLWHTQATLLDAQSKDFTTVVEKLQHLVKGYQAERALDQVHIQDLTKRINTEIEQKNQYKYRPDYKWLWISIGAAVALAGVCFGVGVWVTRD